jgi:hypothetical protein
MSDYNPHSALAAWLDTGWQEDDTECTLAGCFVRPDEPGSGWGTPGHLYLLPPALTPMRGCPKA